MMTRTDTKFAEYKEFRSSINALWKRGGPWQNAATDVYAVLGRAAADASPLEALRLTKHGETRIRNCVKYDLTKFCRLITVQTGGYCILLYCGDHDDCDRWLERHRGFVPIVEEGHVVRVTYRSGDEEAEGTIGGGEGHATGPLHERLPSGMFEDLIAGVHWRVASQLAQMEATVPPSQLLQVVGSVAEPKQRTAIHDVFALLREDRLNEAIARVRLYRGEVATLEDVPVDSLPDIVDSDVIRRIDPRSPQYREALGRFMRSARYRDWMLFMHPDQERIVDEDFGGPAKLVGVSGSGKTCVVVQRAVRLALKYPDERVLVLTINRALAKLIDDLVSACAPEEVRDRIDVKPFFVLCRELMLTIDPRGQRLWNEVTWKSNEHVDEIWQEFYRCENNNYDARVFQDVHDSLLSRGWSPERYLREEVDWLRSALKPDDRELYLDITRTGRTVGLTKPYRRLILEGARAWEDKTTVVGVIDALGLAQALVPFLWRIRPMYRCVLVDEVQDFGNVELEIVRALVESAENDLFLCGDAAQAVTSKFQRFRDVGITVPGTRSRRLALNYRNSRDVLTAAYRVLFHNMTAEMMDREDFEILDPEYSAFSAATPLLLEGTSLTDELEGAFALARARLSELPEGKACIAVCGYSLYELSKFGEEIGVPVLDGTTSIDEGSLFLSDLEQTKGFEFDFVCIVNCSQGVLPDGAAPSEEQYRDLARLYVAMTRAKSDLVISWCGGPSCFFFGLDDVFLRETWTDYMDLEDAPSIGAPRRLDTYREGVHRKSWREMTGEQFLLTDMALGVSTDLSGKLRALVDGIGLKRGRDAIKWRTMGRAADAYLKERRVRAIWGPEVGRQFSELVSRLPELPVPADVATAPTHRTVSPSASLPIPSIEGAVLR